MKMRLAGLLLAMLIWGGGIGSLAPAQWRAQQDSRQRFALPAGWRVVQDFEASAEQTAAIGGKLGAKIVSLSNTVLSANGKRLQVNVIQCATEADATVVAEAISKTKADPAFCLRLGAKAVEFVGDDVALATKAGFELGFKAKPASARYQVAFEVAPIESGDYMSWNAVYQAFVGLSQGDAAARGRIAELAGKFTFGKELRFRYFGPDGAKMQYQFRPGPVEARMDSCGDVLVVGFGELPMKEGIGSVTVSAVVGACGDGTMAAKRRRDDPALVAATAFWPCDDAEIVKLAAQITAGCADDTAKVKMILRWLQPDKNIRFGGPVTGSRYAVKEVLKQRYGHCWDFSDCFVTLARAAKVPCRQVAGWLYGAEGHIWAEVLLDDGKWHQVDPTGGGVLACGIYHVAYLTSEDGRMPLLYLSQPQIVMLGN